MIKLIFFFLLYRLLGNPILAILVLLAVVYLADRRFVGIFPSITRPFVVNKRMSLLKNTLRLNPHDTSSKVELARLLLEKKRYGEALPLLQDASNVMSDSAEVRYEFGYCHLKLEDLDTGESLILKALEINPRTHYGTPYLRLGEAFASTQPDKAIRYLEEFQSIHSSSVEGYYRLGLLYTALGKTEAAKQSHREAVEIYRGLPKYKKRTERRWASLSWFKK